MSYQSYATTETKEGVEVDHLDKVKVATDNDIEDDSEQNSGSSTQETAKSVSKPPKTSPSQSSSQAASSKPAPLEPREAKENIQKGIQNFIIKGFIF